MEPNFKQFKHKTGMNSLKDLFGSKRFETINSRHPSKGVTPSGNVPLPSTSNFLIGANSGMMGVMPEIRPN